MSFQIAQAKFLSEKLIQLEFFQEDITLGLEEVKIGWEMALSLDTSRTSFVYLKTAKWSLLDKEARNYVINEIKKWPRVAILLHHLSQRIIGNFAVNLSGNSKNVHIFVNETEALKWLQNK